MKKTQKQVIAEKLEKEGVVDNFWAFETKTTLRLGAIIERLRHDGWNIETKMVGKNCHYYLRGKPDTSTVRGGGLFDIKNGVSVLRGTDLFPSTLFVSAKQDFRNF